MHHAVLIVGDVHESLALIDASERTPGPDVSIEAYIRFGIDEARALCHRASLMPMNRPHRVFIMSFGTITLEAQNALLKLFEDPNETSRFYILAESADVFIPTLRSRFMELRGKEKQPASHSAEAFLKNAYKDRLEEIAKRMKEKDTSWTEELLAGLEIVIERRGDSALLRDLLMVRKYDKARSASQKMLLEHLALALPVM